MPFARSILCTLSLLAVACGGPACGGPADDGGDAREPKPIAPPPYESFSKRPCPSDSVLTWENFGEPFVRSWCTTCHGADVQEEHRVGAPVGIDFDDLDGVRQHAQRIWDRSGDQNNTMPPAGVPPDAERSQLGEWLACGARSRDDG